VHVKTFWETWGYQNQRHMGKLITDKHKNIGGGNQWNDISGMISVLLSESCSLPNDADCIVKRRD
jgi:hypothetical protein